MRSEPIRSSTRVAFERGITWSVPERNTRTGVWISGSAARTIFIIADISTMAGTGIRGYASSS